MPHRCFPRKNVVEGHEADPMASSHEPVCLSGLPVVSHYWPMCTRHVVENLALPVHTPHTSYKEYLGFTQSKLGFKSVLDFRTKLAALHQNENAGHVQAANWEGKLGWERKMVRAKEGQDAVCAMIMKASQLRVCN